jgi:hypothetical protein
MPVESKDKNYLELHTRKLQIRSSSSKLSSKTLGDRQTYDSHSAYPNLTLRFMPFTFNIILNYFIKEKNCVFKCFNSQLHHKIKETVLIVEQSYS